MSSTGLDRENRKKFHRICHCEPFWAKQSPNYEEIASGRSTLPSQ
jgi:hypothetical protein